MKKARVLERLNKGDYFTSFNGQCYFYGNKFFKPIYIRGLDLITITDNKNGKVVKALRNTVKTSQLDCHISKLNQRK